eukprot:1845151-Amphidinium_carterae.1
MVTVSIHNMLFAVTQVDFKHEVNLANDQVHFSPDSNQALIAVAAGPFLVAAAVSTTVLVPEISSGSQLDVLSMMLQSSTMPATPDETCTVDLYMKVLVSFLSRVDLGAMLPDTRREAVLRFLLRHRQLPDARDVAAYAKRGVIIDSLLSSYAQPLIADDMESIESLQ